MAGSADHEGFAASFRHDVRPRGWWLSGFVEVGEFTDVVHLYLVRAVAELAPVGE